MFLAASIGILMTMIFALVRALLGPTVYDRVLAVNMFGTKTGPIAGALNKCLEMVPVLETNAQREIIPELDSALRRGTGKAFPVNIGFDIPFRLAPLWLIVR